ncbi:ABC transporter ATP-binding protein [Acinetobacter qingfengensis]|uniref:ABC transporter ATP-binding protein n=1 Tax=Acinetobacter qingfengensis TaxID=1262585 RepID=A0A1E7R3R5_9GAMM|nr:ABC transporter ATP-binding protein [Acinetobacter qingfengensis]KAA8735384.1 ABC transporter ATP-binding protein [Acinetobacter qingfengensis]OEY93897.1 ABC transporter ATP-binding protein [Acinetobacter qingfengensis]
MNANVNTEYKANATVNQHALKANIVEFKDIQKQFIVNRHPVKVIENFNLTIKEGEFVAIVGSSGCGKSTLLRLLAGLDNDFSGEIKVDGQPIAGVGHDRAVVFQEHRLFPWLTVEQNIELGLINEKISTQDKTQRIEKAIALIGLNGFEKAYPHQLSGGMSQRVAIARSLVSQPRIFLLDEPFGALDALTRYQMQNELLRIQAQERITTIFITHDVEEAVTLADRVVILKPKPGRIEQIIAIDLPRPRNRSSFELHQLKEQVFKILTEDKII